MTPDLVILTKLKRHPGSVSLPTLTAELNINGLDLSESQVDDELGILDASGLVTRLATTVGSYTRISASLTPDGRHRLAQLGL